MRLRAALLTQKWKQTVIFTLRFKMLTARTPELSAPKFLLAQNGVRFDKWCSAGRSRSFHSRSRACTTLQLPSTSSPLRAKPFATLLTHQRIIQTGDETGSDAMKYWEIIADRLSNAGWSLGWVSAIDSQGRTIWIVDAHRDDGRRFIVRAEELLTAFVELERQVLTVTFYLESLDANDCKLKSGEQSPPHGGGVAAPVRKCREATEAAQTGWSNTTQTRIPKHFGKSTTPSAPSEDASRYFLDVASTPPLQGGECATLSNSLTEAGTIAYPKPFVQPKRPTASCLAAVE